MGDGQSVLWKKGRKKQQPEEIGSAQELKWPKAEVNF